MKKNYMISAVMLLLAGAASAQWCVPNTAIPYGTGMPGITQFTLNTINRPSADLEHYPANNYTNTGLSTTLAPGSTYNVTIGYTIDASICPDMNLRVWIDYNQDGQLDDPGETVISVDHQTALTYTGSFTVPANVMTGTTCIRVSAKMTNNGGHTAPTPCDIPNDPLGYHGEFEDYTAVIQPTGIASPEISALHMQLAPNPFSAGTLFLHYQLPQSATVSATLVDIEGRVVAMPLRDAQQAAGDQILSLTEPVRALAPGIYIVRLTAGGKSSVQKLIVTEE